MHAVNAVLQSVLEMIAYILDLYIWVLIISAVLSWLVAFNVINIRNRFVQFVGDFTYRLTEPPLRLIRRYLPPIGGLDLSPIILILIIMLLQKIIFHLVYF